MTETVLEPIFLVGALRSGTTVSHLMLNSHPQISNPGEYDFFFDYVSDEGVALDPITLLNQLEKNRVYQNSGLKYDSSLDYKANLQQFFEQLADGKENLIINIHRNYHRIIKLFPHARFLHLIRDPRDVARSSIVMGWAGNVYYGVNHWIGSETSWDMLARQLTDKQYMEFKFEELIEQPDETLTRICEFIGVPFTDQMYDYQNQSTYSAPDKTLVWQWKTKLSSHEIQLVELKAGRLMIDRGYTLASNPDFTIGFIKKLGLYLQNKMAIWRHGIDRFGLSLLLAEKLTRKLHLDQQHTKVMQKINAIAQKAVK